MTTRSRRTTAANEELSDFVLGLPAVDAHEHLRLEEVRLAKKPDAIWLFHQYAISDLRSAGMSEADAKEVKDISRPLPERWRMFKPFFERIRHTGYARAVLIALRDIYGFDTLDDRTVEPASERILAENKPGMIDRWLHRKGNIVAIINHNYELRQPAHCIGVMMLHSLAQPQDRGTIEQFAAPVRVEVKDLESWLACAEALLEKYAESGVVGLKMISFPWSPVDRAEAERLFARLLGGAALDPGETARLRSHLIEGILRLVPPRDFTVAVHCGYLSGNNQDFTETHIRHMVPLLQRHPDVRFDLFHLSYPWVDEAIAIAKQFTNVSLNLAWCAIVNPSATQRAMVELVGAVPANKVLALGGDYWELPDVSYGHLKIARGLVARSLGICVDEGQISLDEAKRVAELWMRENAYTIYPRLPRP